MMGRPVTRRPAPVLRGAASQVNERRGFGRFAVVAGVIASGMVCHMQPEVPLKPCPVRRAIVSVFDKEGVADFARTLVKEFGIEVLATGRTASGLRRAGLAVTPVEDVTGSGEMLDGRVKTLHPHIHAAILADRAKPEHMRQLAQAGTQPIDMVVVNLYPFEQTVARAECTVDEAVEMIDIGGPCMLRAAAKNHHHVWAVCSRNRFTQVCQALRGDATDRARAALRAGLAAEAFEHVAHYDRAVADYLVRAAGSDRVQTDAPAALKIPSRWAAREVLRYGENPHQRAQCWIAGNEHNEARVTRQVMPADAAMSFNNYADADAALNVCKDLTRELAVDAVDRSQRFASIFVKHSNPCGVGVGPDALEAYRSAYLGDPNAAMGGVLACNHTVTTDFASAVMRTYDRLGRSAGAGGFFVEVWVAPSFEAGAKEAIGELKSWGRRVRLVPVGDMCVAPDEFDSDCRKLVGGMLVQDRDLAGLNESDWTVMTRRAPTEAELCDLRVAWLACKHTRSNAVSICRDGMLLGNGAGQMSRVMSCRIATWAAGHNGHGQRLSGSVAASDGFFPFRDGPDMLIEAGVRAIIQPGGSKRDAEVVAACDEQGVAMVFAGMRHFCH